MTTQRQRLAIRGAAASFATNLIAAVSHTLGGERAPAPLVVVGMMALLWAPSMALMGRRPRAGRIAATVIAAQAAFHSVYAALGFPTGAAIDGAVAPHSHALFAPAATSVASAPGPLMVVSHAAAAAVTFVVLMFGEHAIRVVREWAIQTLRARSAILPPRIGGYRIAAAAPTPCLRSRRGFALIGPRGPPLPSV